MIDKGRVNLTKVVFDNSDVINCTNLFLDDGLYERDFLKKIKRRELKNIMFVRMVYNHYGYNNNIKSNTDEMIDILIDLLK